MGQIIKGKPVADSITAEIVKDVEVLKSKDIEPKLKIVRVGAREDDLAYERGALSRMEKCGIKHEATLEKALSKKGRVYDEAVYRILRSEYSGRKF